MGWRLGFRALGFGGMGVDGHFFWGGSRVEVNFGRIARVLQFRNCDLELLTFV